MAIRLLFDTDVIIDYLRDQSDAVQYLENRPEILLISSIVVAELYSGLRGESEREALETFLKAFEIKLCPYQMMLLCILPTEQVQLVAKT